MSAFQVVRIHHDREKMLGAYTTMPNAVGAALRASRLGPEPVEVRADDGEIHILARYVAGVRVHFEGTVMA